MLRYPQENLDPATSEVINNDVIQQQRKMSADKGMLTVEDKVKAVDVVVAKEDKTAKDTNEKQNNAAIEKVAKTEYIKPVIKEGREVKELKFSEKVGDDKKKEDSTPEAKPKDEKAKSNVGFGFPYPNNQMYIPPPANSGIPYNVWDSI
jgi:hypothetical protein